MFSMMAVGFPFLHILTAFVIFVFFFNNSHPNRCEMVAHYGLDLP